MTAAASIPPHPRRMMDSTFILNVLSGIRLGPTRGAHQPGRTRDLHRAVGHKGLEYFGQCGDHLCAHGRSRFIIGGRGRPHSCHLFDGFGDGAEI